MNKSRKGCKLVIVESPSKSKTIEKYLDPSFEVISSYGHVRALPSEAGAVDPNQDFAMRYEIVEKSTKQVNHIIQKAKAAKELYLATDPDREGEAISWHIYEILKENNIIEQLDSVKRITFYEITKDAVLKAIENSRDIDDNLVNAQQTRQGLDYLFGFTLSPVLWRKLPKSKSAGRVQSVALRIICDRETEIEKFKAQEYWSIKGLFNHNKGNIESDLVGLEGNKLEKFSITNEEQAKKALQKLLQCKYSISTISTKQTTRNPYPPFTTSSLIQEASNKLGFSAKKTSLIAQNLYEGMEIDNSTVALITYMRTDSFNIAEVAVEAARNLISKDYGGQYLPKNPRVYKTKAKNSQEAHEAIRPTDVNIRPETLMGKLPKDHYNLYTLIWRRLVACQMESAKLEVLSIIIEDQAKQHTFRGSSTSIIFQGFLKVYKDNTDEKKDNEKQPYIAAGLQENDNVEIEKLEDKQHFTQPPPRYSEASLVKKMEELGIGRPSTYPNIISILQAREYVRLESRRFMPEIRGRVVNAFLHHYFPNYIQYDFTANLEQQLDEISDGKVMWKKPLHDFYFPLKETAENVVTFKNSDVIKNIEQDLETVIFGHNEEGNLNKQCPQCDSGELSLKAGKFGFFIGCSTYPECKYIKNIGATQQDEHPEDASRYPIVLGQDSEDAEITLRKGPYGMYVQRTLNKEIKRSSLPAKKDLAEVDLEYALFLLTLPMKLGTHPSTQKDILLNRGKFGFYLMYDEKSYSIKGIEPGTVTVGMATEIIAKKDAAPTKKTTKKSSTKK